MKDIIKIDDVLYYREPPDLTKAKNVIDKYDALKVHINETFDKVQNSYDNMRDNGLSLNMLVMEGYLRAYMELKQKIEEIESED